MSTYITSQGDMWDSVAKSQLGSEKYTDLLIAENPEHRFVYIFSAGVELNIPEVNEQTSVSDLPPWKVAAG